VPDSVGVLEWLEERVLDVEREKGLTRSREPEKWRLKPWNK
jgi:hypothetical protein